MEDLDLERRGISDPTKHSRDLFVIYLLSIQSFRPSCQQPLLSLFESSFWKKTLVKGQPMSVSCHPDRMSLQTVLCLCSSITFLFDFGLASNQLKYLWGDAIDDPLAVSPADGQPYPWELTTKMAGRQLRHARTFVKEGMPELLSPEETRKILLRSFQVQNGYDPDWRFKEGSGIFQKENLSSKGQGRRKGRAKEGNGTMSTTKEPIKDEYEGCVPSRLCPTTYNTTAPLYGISLTSGKPVTIVQKFPDLLQQVVFQVCKSSDCDVIHGECVQTFIPYLFLVLPLGPVSITGQDYILVESGCTCQPRYAKRHLSPPLPFIQPIN